MREQFMVGMRAVFIYLYGLSFFVKGRRQVTYGSFIVITYFIKARGNKIIRSKYTMSIFYFLRR